MRRNTVETFWSSINKVGDCWLWCKGLTGAGYGATSFNSKWYYAHRLAYELFYNVDPADLEVCHSCDNPSCINPKHLFLGTHQENMDDCKRKGRHKISDLDYVKDHPVPRVSGESIKSSVLTLKQVTDMRKEYSEGGITQKELAAKYGVTPANVSLILANKTWKV